MSTPIYSDHNTPAISMNPRYHDGLRSFKARCSDYETIKQAITDVFKDGIVNFATNAGLSAELCILDIGCGDGIITEHLARVLATVGYGRTMLDVLEPVSDYIEKTKARLGKLIDSGLSARFTQASAQDCFSGPSDKQYDLILSSHSMHLIPLGTLQSISAAIKTGGYFLVVIGAQPSIMSILKDLFTPKPTITGADVLRFMQRVDLVGHYRILHQSRPSKLNMKGIILPPNKYDLSEEARNLLSLMIQKDVDEIDRPAYEKVRALVMEQLVDEELLLENDLFIFQKK